MGMAETKSVRFTKEQIDGLEEMEERELADNGSEAHRMIFNAGMREYGLGVTDTTSRLSRIATQFAWIFGVIGLAWLAVTITYPVGLRMPAMAAFSSSFGCWAFGQAIDHYDISLNVFGGESA